MKGNVLIGKGLNVVSLTNQLETAWVQPAKKKLYIQRHLKTTTKG